MQSSPPPKFARPKQVLPSEIIGDLMGAIRNQFYAGNEAWFADQEFIRRRVVTWPAKWLNARGVSLKPQRYKSLMLDIFQDIKTVSYTHLDVYKRQG